MSPTPTPPATTSPTTSLLKSSPLSNPWVRTLALIAAVAALAAIAVYAPSCQSKRKSVLTGETVTLDQAYEDLDKKAELDKAQSERDAAKAAAAEAKDKADAQAALEKATKEADRRTAKERRDFNRFADETRADAELKIKQIEQEARAKITAASDKLEDAQALSDDALAEQVAQIRKTAQDLIDARNEAVEEKIRKRSESLAAEKSSIDGQAKADAAKWSWVSSVFSVAKPLLALVPGGGAAGDGINTLLAIATAGGGAYALRKRSETAKTKEERDEYAKLAEQMQEQAAANEEKLKKSLAAVVSITDSIEQAKDKMPPGVWDAIKNDVRGWQGPQAEQLVNAARNHIDPIKVL
mgnify:CR=1 FL=1